MSPPTIYIIDDEPAVREGMQTLFQVAGYQVETFAGGEQFLAHKPVAHGCILLDLRMPELNGLEVQEAIVRRGIQLPIIFLTAYGDIPQTVRAIKAGAADVLTKPVDGASLINRVESVLSDHQGNLDQTRASAKLRQSLDLLTSRERQVLELVLQGLATRDIARQLGISHRTVEVHRSHIVKKTGTENLYHFYRIVTSTKLKLD